MMAEKDKNFESEDNNVKEEKSDIKKDKRSTVELEEDITEEVLIERLKEVKDELAVATEEKDQYLNQMKRLKADFVNYRNRVKKDKNKIEIRTKIDIISSLIPVIDNFERALKTVDQETEFLSGVKMIKKQLINVLKKEGLEIIKTDGQEFDPAYHEAVMQVESDEHESGYIVEEIQKGYLVDEEVVRPAMVKVAI
ncbi:MAG: nucleotide exchange factor GrpE [Halanaerobiales bacterium]|nr:nucleotide exchange factor GrpE [Halanaerobiales bacterium]